jgi:hypothetical protein
LHEVRNEFGERRSVASAGLWEDVVVGVYQGVSAQMLSSAEDEARMLGQTQIAPEHLLLAFARHGGFRHLRSAERLEVTGTDVWDALVRSGGRGDELALGDLPYSAALGRVLERAFVLGTERGSLAPQLEHILLALSEEARCAALLSALGLSDIPALVEERDRRPGNPLSPEQVRHQLFAVAISARPPRRSREPVAYERFTRQARHAVRAASEVAALLEHREVEPFHLLLGCLHVPESLAGRVLAAGLEPSEMGTLDEAMERARMYGPHPAHQATGIFTDAAHHIVAEAALKQAYRLDHAVIGTGHLLLAILDHPDRTMDRIVGSGVMGSGPVLDRIARETARRLPGGESTDHQLESGVINLDALIRLLSSRFAAILPAGWTVRGSGRRNGIRLNVPDSRSEEDFRIDFGWIITHDAPAAARLLEVTRSALQSLQHAVSTHTNRPWPEESGMVPGRQPEANAEIGGDDANPALRLWYGDATSSALEVLSRPPLLNQVISRSS